jgi:hypothetical protein
LALLRDGWKIVQDGKAQFNLERKATYFVTHDPPEILTQQNPNLKSISLQRVRSRALIRHGKQLSDLRPRRLQAVLSPGWAKTS